MEIKELENWAKMEISELEQKYGVEKDSWAYALKVGEELGEVYDALLASKGYQRKEKMQKNSKVEKEICDLILTSVILAKSLGIPLEKTLHERLEELKLRNLK